MEVIPTVIAVFSLALAVLLLRRILLRKRQAPVKRSQGHN